MLAREDGSDADTKFQVITQDSGVSYNCRRAAMKQWIVPTKSMLHKNAVAHSRLKAHDG